tara:strand:- start:2125 stop:2460 length:336 start_codon:yes stop_codon:yes gene_type:complete
MNFILNSRLALVGIAVSLVLVWHYIDKAVAVRSAEKELADQVKIESLMAERDEAKRRAGIEALAKKRLRSMVTVAEETALKAEKELEDYVQSTDQNIECVVDTSILERLRN